MTLAPGEFIRRFLIRRFLIHVLPPGFHRIRHYGLFANGGRTENLARARALLAAEPRQDQPEPVMDADEPPSLSIPCPCCGGRMIIIETFEHNSAPRAPPTGVRGIGTS